MDYGKILVNMSKWTANLPTKQIIKKINKTFKKIKYEKKKK